MATTPIASHILERSRTRQKKIASIERPTTPPVATLAFVVDGKPVPAERPRVVRLKGGRGRGRKGRVITFTPDKTKNYEALVGRCASAAIFAHPTWRALDHGALFYGVTLDVYRKELRGDADNLAKSALDGCKGIAWIDDRDVIHLDTWSLLDRASPRLEMTIQAWPKTA